MSCSPTDRLLHRSCSPTDSLLYRSCSPTDSLLCRSCSPTTTLKECVPLLCSYETLKKQFDWLIDGEVAHLIEANLRPELRTMETFLR